ncbi:MAG: GNAT family N-acetyltransferase [Sedimenticola sp.]
MSDDLDGISGKPIIDMRRIDLPAQEGLERYAVEWQARNRDMFNSHPLLDLRFIRLLLNYFGSGNERLVAVEDSGRLETAILVQPKHWGFWESFMPSQAQISPAMIKNQAEIPQLFDAMSFPRPFILDVLGQDSAFSEYEDRDRETEIMPHARTINIHLNGSFEEYWSSRPAKLRQNVGRYIRRLEQEYPDVDFRELRNQSEMCEAVKRYADLESSGWKGKIGTALSSENNQLALYTDIMSTYAEQGQAIVYELLIEGRVIASRLAISSEHHIVMLKTTYDESFSRLAPGRVLLYRVLQKLFSEKEDCYVEFYTNATNDQKKWATGERDICHVTCYANILGFTLAKIGKKALRVANHLSSLKLTPLPADEERIQVQVLSDLETFTHNREAIGRESENSSFFQSIHWFENLARTILDKSQELRVYQYRDNQKQDDMPQVLAPFYARTKWGVRTLESLSNYYTSLYGPVFDSRKNVPAALDAIVGSLVEEKPSWHLVHVAPLDPERETFEPLIEAFSKRGWWIQKYFIFGNWYLPCKGLTYQQYLADRPSRLKNTLRRKQRQFTVKLGARLEIYDQPEDVEMAVEAFNAVYRRSWKKAEPYPDFIYGLAGICAKRGWLRLGVAWLGDKPIAAQFWIVSGGIASIYKLAYDNEFRSLSPGSILSAHLMKHVLDIDRVHEVDYLTGDDTYKSQWMSHRRERFGIMAVNSRTWLGIPLAIRHFGRSWLHRSINKLVRWTGFQ